MELTDKELGAIYLPHDRDETLAPEEYYYLQSTRSGERVIRVEVRYIYPMHDGTEYGITQNGKHVDVGYGDQLRGVRKSALYDNKHDCRAQTHLMFDGWEALRFRLTHKGGADK